MTISGQKEMLWCICGLASDGSPETTYLRCFQDFDTFLVIPDVAGSSPVIRPRLKMAPFGAFFDPGRMAGLESQKCWRVGPAQDALRPERFRAAEGPRQHFVRPVGASRHPPQIENGPFRGLF